MSDQPERDPVELAKGLAAIPESYASPKASRLGKLPRVTCKKCSSAESGVCSDHEKSRCRTCGAYITSAHIHLDFEGHADVTLDLIAIDPLWTWEPLAYEPTGMPVIAERVKRNGNREKLFLVMWARLTVLGKTLIEVGSCEASKDDPEKELVGDFLRRGAMRFGVATKLWSKVEREAARHDEPSGDVPAAEPARRTSAKRAQAKQERASRAEREGHAWTERKWKQEMDDRGVTLAKLNDWLAKHHPDAGVMSNVGQIMGLDDPVRHALNRKLLSTPVQPKAEASAETSEPDPKRAEVASKAVADVAEQLAKIQQRRASEGVEQTARDGHQ